MNSAALAILITTAALWQREGLRIRVPGVSA